MMTHQEESLERDAARIRHSVVEMAGRAERALKDCVTALVDNNRQLANAIILRDLFIDKQEEEIDQLCLEFIVRQQPVGSNLRFAYSTFKINLEIERVGDYAESVARHILKLPSRPARELCDRIVQIAELSTGMFRDSIKAFLDQNQELARVSVEIEDTVDRLRHQFNRELVRHLNEQSMSFEMFDPLITITKRFERVSDQARNICMEVLYMCTGQYVKHPGADQFRVLLIDDTGACLAPMAEEIGRTIGQKIFNFRGAGIGLDAISKDTVDFMTGKGHDISHAISRSIEQIVNLEHYHVLVTLTKSARKALPRIPAKAIVIEWDLRDPSSEAGGSQQVSELYEHAYSALRERLTDLVQAVVEPGNVPQQ